MNKIVPVLLAIPLCAYVDLGVQGKTYEIKEKNIKTLLIDGVRKLDKEDLKKRYLRSIDKAFNAKVSLPTSLEDKTLTYIDEVVVGYDVPDPANPGRILYHKGERIKSALPDGAVLNMCFIDAANIDIAKEAVEEFGRCDYLIANRDIRKVNFTGDNLVFPMGMAYVHRFNIDKLPVKLVMKGAQITKIYLNTARLARKARERMYAK